MALLDMINTIALVMGYWFMISIIGGFVWIALRRNRVIQFQIASPSPTDSVVKSVALQSLAI